MVTEQSERTVVTQEPTVGAGQETVRTDSQLITRTGPGAAEYARRIIVLVFGLIQLVIVARIVLLLLNARSSNDLVAGVLNVSQVLVAPFNGILQTDSLNASGATLDVAAIVAFVGWTILELVLIWAMRIFRRTPA